MAALNYAKEYSNVLAQAYPYTLNFGICMQHQIMEDIDGLVLKQ